MALKNLTIDTLGDLSGGMARGIINEAIKAAVFDLDDRGGDGKPRKVTIELVLGKVKGQSLAEVTARTTLPPYRTDTTVGTMLEKQGKRGMQKVFAFQEHDPECAEQGTFPAMDGEDEQQG